MISLMINELCKEIAPSKQKIMELFMMFNNNTISGNLYEYKNMGIGFTVALFGILCWH